MACYQTVMLKDLAIICMVDLACMLIRRLSCWRVLSYAGARFWATHHKMPPARRQGCQQQRLRCSQELSLSESLHFMVPGLASVGALSDLRSLSMERVGVTNGVLRALGGLTRLRALHLPDAFRATDAGIAHLCALTGEYSYNLGLIISRSESHENLS